MKKILQIALMTIVMLLSVSVTAQVTTSSMSGKVSGSSGSLPGAAVVVKHVPSGTVYGTTTNADGRFMIQGMRVGGPYSVSITFMGYHKANYENIQLKLGETYTLNAKLTEETQSLKGIEVVEYDESSSQKTGITTDISTNELSSLPTITRQVDDFIRLSPLNNGSNSFAGRDNRYNNFTVDGAAFNNNFGLSSGFPGGGAPISIDALEQISVNISSFDIRQSNFTGANINSVTRSGDNKFRGTAYTFLRPKDFTGNKIGDNDISGANDASRKLYGVSFSGPIIKDKLFFFINGEYENENAPNSSMAWNPSTDGVGNSEKHISRTTVSDLETVKNYLINNYSFDPGSYQNRGNFNTKVYRILGRIDWNINEKNKLTVRANYTKQSADNPTNANSTAYSLTRGSGRNSISAISYTGSNYIMNNIVGSVTGEWNSIISTKMSNKLLASYTHIADKRTTSLDGTSNDNFPFVDIWEDGDQYMSFGYELFSKNNAVINNVTNFTDNLSIYLGNHTITAGISYDYMYFKNSYLRYATGYYRYNSVADFLNGATPAAYSLTYGFDNHDAPGSELNFGYGAVYGQDEWNINDNFKLTFGVRFEVPFYLNTLTDNPTDYKTAYEFKDGRHIDLSQWPNSNLLVSPRVGFNWDILGDKSLQLRGGTGLFTGYLPFVWFTNQPSNSGVIQNMVDVTNATILEQIGFNTNYKDIINKGLTYADGTLVFPTNSKDVSALPTALCIVDPDFRLPQIWRTNLAVDYKLPWDMVLTLEGVYSKDINVVVQENINECDPSTTIVENNGKTRDSWWVKNESTGKWSKTYKLNNYFSSVMMLTNASEGYQYSLTAELTKKFSYGLEGMIAYTHSVSKDLTTNPGSAAASAWSSNVAVNSLNSPSLSYSNWSIPHRIVGALTYSHELDKVFGFSVSLYYSGSAQDRYSYTYSNDLNGDNNSSDLMYIPTDVNDITFVDVKDKEGNVTMTAADQANALMDYINDDNYLSNHKGEYAERFGKIGPWINRFDAKLLVNLFTNFGTERRYTLQLTLDCKNIGNLINNTWGVYQTCGLASYENIRLLKFAGMENGGDNPTPTYTLNASSIENFKSSSKFVDNAVISNAWQMLLGIRFIF